jgi:hypothetical protein
VHIIDVNDWELQCFTPLGDLVYGAPCAASSDDRNVFLGTEALARAKIFPQTFTSNYLYQISEAPFSGAVGNLRTYADLSFKQFEDLREKAQVREAVFLVPSYLQDQYLGILAGIAKAASITPLGFIDHCAACAYNTSLKQSFTTLDIGLNQTIVSSIEVENREFRVTSASQTSLGMIGIADNWISCIADEFIRNFRFDPLYSAATEQQMFDEVISWIESGELPADLKISVRTADAERSITLIPDLLQKYLVAKLDETNLDKTTAVVLSHRFNRIPLIKDILEDRVSRCYVADQKEVAAAALAIAADFESGKLERLRACSALSRNEESISNVRSAHDQERALLRPATHLLESANAYSIKHRKFDAFLDEDGLLRPGVKIEIDGGEPTSAVIKAGQNVCYSGNSWLAIRES